MTGWWVRFAPAPRAWQVWAACGRFKRGWSATEDTEDTEDTERGEGGADETRRACEDGNLNLLEWCILVHLVAFSAFAGRYGWGIACALASSNGVPFEIAGTRSTGESPVPPRSQHGQDARDTRWLYSVEKERASILRGVGARL